MTATGVHHVWVTDKDNSPAGVISIGDILLGLPSSGVHSNGFSLVRKIVSVSGLNYSSPCPWDPTVTLGAALLAPTKIYVKALLPVIRKGTLKGLSHITGGGFLENIPRVLPSGKGAISTSGLGNHLKSSSG